MAHPSGHVSKHTELIDSDRTEPIDGGDAEFPVASMGSTITTSRSWRSPGILK